MAVCQDAKLRKYSVIVLVILVLASKKGQSRDIVKSRCLEQCICFPVLKNKTTLPAMYHKSRDSTNITVEAVSCKREQLKTVPRGIGIDTAVLFLSYNSITSLNRSMFEGLHQIQALDLSHNKIESIANDTFNDLNFLEQLDLTYNLLRRLPTGSFCPWFRREFGTEIENSGCSSWIKAYAPLRLFLNHNPWHCNCHLQEFIEEYSCALLETACIAFAYDMQDPIGYCTSPEHMRRHPLIWLSSSQSGGGDKSVDVCKHRPNYIDIPLLITIFTWMGAVLGYVVYFISWNNRDIASHRSYLSTLNFQTYTPTRRKSEFRERTSTVTSSTCGTDSRLRPLTKSATVNKAHKQETPPRVQITKPTTPEIWIPRLSIYNDDQTDGPTTHAEPNSSDRQSDTSDRGLELILRTPETFKTCDSYRSSSL